MVAAIDPKAEAIRQLERATCLLGASARGSGILRTPVHKSLEQLFGEARARGQPQGALAGAAHAGLPGASRILQSAQAQQLDRDVADLALGQGGGDVGALAGGAPAAEDQPSLGAREFFALRHEKVLTNAVEEAHRDCMRSAERHSFDSIQAGWEEAKKQIMSAMVRQRLGPATVGLAVGGDDNSELPAPQQDALILECMAREPMGQALVRRVCQLSCEGCPAYRSELAESWNILYHSLEKTPRAATCGALAYLQGRFAEEVKCAVYSSSSAQLGGVANSWAIVCAYGRARFEADTFPANTTHAWYAAYIAARAGFAQLLAELPERAAPSADRCPLFRAVCRQMARRLQATSLAGDAAGAADAAGQGELLPADPGGAGDPFRDVLVALLQGQSFAVSRRLEGTVEDWLWFRLHLVQRLAGDSDQAPEFRAQLEALRQDVLARPQSHYDPTASACAAAGGGGAALPSAAYGLGGLVSLFASPTAAVPAASLAGAGVAQTLNFVKVLLLTAQFDRAVQQMFAQDRCLQAPALHMALVLRKAGTLEALSPAASSAPLDVAGLVRQYAGRFRPADRLRYFQVLDAAERHKAVEHMLLGTGALASDELLGSLDASGRHRPGLLERTLTQDGLGDRAEFAKLCATAGHTAAERGQYREAIRLLHLGRCYGEVLSVLCRCLRLPMWREASAEASDEAQMLAQDIQRFFSIYERNLDRYALPSQGWAVARKLYGARVFHSLCSQGQLEAALDTFDREQLLPLTADQALGAEVDAELLPEYPRIVADYARALRRAAAQGAASSALQGRVRQLQTFLAVQSHRVPLDQETVAALAGLVLC